MTNKSFGWLVALLIVGALVAVAGISNGWFGAGQRGPIARPTTANSKEASNEPTIDPNKSPGPGYVKVGGIWRPAIDVERKSDESNTETKYASLPSAGSTPVVAYDANKSTRLIKEALDSGDEKLISRLSVMHEAKPFDRAAFEKDPQTYLDEVEPGRIWQSAPEGEGVKQIARYGDFYRQLLQGESAPLTVKVAPLMPVTFYSPHLGRFENQLTSITVRADENGKATATWTAAPGTHDETTIVVASPSTSGQANFLIDVVIPDSGISQPK